MKLYIKKNNSIYFDGFEVHYPDAESFVDLGLGWAKDKAHGYHGVNKLYYCDLSTLQPINESYAKDKKQLFYKNYTSIENPEEFSLLEGAFIKEHIHDLDIFSLGESIDNVESDTQYQIKQCIRDKKKVYFQGYKVPYADPNTFKIICSLYYKRFLYAKDKSNIFFYDEMLGKFKRLKGLDPDTFKILNMQYVMDEKNVLHYFSEHIVLESVNSQKFQALGGHYAIDDRFVYYQNSIIPEADVTCFEIVTDGQYGYYGKDNNHVFHNEIILKNVDPKTFKFSGIFKDSKHQVILDKVRKFDPDTFVDLSFGYVKELGKIFFNGYPLSGADFDTFFMVTPWPYGVDKNHVFHGGYIDDDMKVNDELLGTIQKFKPGFSFE